MHSYIPFPQQALLDSEVGGRAWVSKATPPEVGVKSQPHSSGAIPHRWGGPRLEALQAVAGWTSPLPFNLQQLRLLPQPLQIQRLFEWNGSPQSMGLLDASCFLSCFHPTITEHMLPSWTSWLAPEGDCGWWPFAWMWDLQLLKQTSCWFFFFIWEKAQSCLTAVCHPCFLCSYLEVWERLSLLLMSRFPIC